MSHRRLSADFRHGKDGRGIFPDRLIGCGMATMNTSVMLGVACMQTLSGLILGAFEPLADGARSEAAYRERNAMRWNRARFHLIAFARIGAACCRRHDGSG